jgi:hypothetical protein
MKKSTLGFLLSAVFLASSTLASSWMPSNIKEYKQSKKAGGTNWKAAIVYIGGMGHGIEAANAYLASIHQQVTYCPPENLVMRISNYMDAIDLAIKKHEPISQDDFPVDLVLLDGLQELFPCQRK